MNRKTLATAIADKAGLTLKDALVCVDVMFENIALALIADEKIDIRGFGTFSVKKRDERKGVNPRTGERITISSRKLPSFKPGKELKERINS